MYVIYLLLSEFGIKFALHGIDHIVHDLVYAGVIKSLILILQQETYGVALLARLKVL